MESSYSYKNTDKLEIRNTIKSVHDKHGMTGGAGKDAANGTGGGKPRRSFARSFSHVDTKVKPAKDGQVPFSRASILSRASYWWMWSIMLGIRKRGLTSLLAMSWFEEDAAAFQVQRLEQCWMQELKDKGQTQASLQKAMILAFKRPLLKTVIIIIITLSFSYIGSAFILRFLLDHISSAQPDINMGITLVVALIVCECFRSFTFSLAWSCNYFNGMRGRSGAMGLLYKKILRLRSLKDWNIGELVNLFSHDGQRVFEAMANGPFTVGGLLIFLAGSVYLCVLMGFWGLVAIATYIAIFIIIAILNGGIEHFRKKAVNLTSKRVGLMTEVLTCMKLIKMNSWQTAFIGRIGQCREEEQGALLKASFLKSIVTSMVPMIPVIASVFLFLGYMLSGNDLTASQAFTVISVFYAMSFSLASALYGVQTLIDVGVAMRRYKEILLMEEQTLHKETTDESLAIEINMASMTWEADDEVDVDIETREEDSIIGGLKAEEVQNLPSSPLPLPNRCSIRFEDVSNSDTTETSTALIGSKEKDGSAPAVAREESDSSSILALQDIDISVKKGELIGVCGMKGSGKTSLLSALLGRMQIVEGDIRVSGSIAYLSQDPWIMNGTAKENILFGRQFDAVRYDKAIKATKLDKDFETFSARDEVEIGDRGLTLSGGQKQRISLARAIYSDLDIYLLDDPLSAVDVNVGRHIFSQCIKTILHSKTVIMVTHHLEYLPKCHKVLYLNNGGVAAFGTHADLFESNTQYAELSTLYNSKYDRILKERMKAKDKRESQTIPQRGFSKVSKRDLNRQISRMSVSAGVQNQVSVVSNSSFADFENGDIEELVNSRNQPDCRVRSSTYATYIRAMGGVVILVFLLFMFMISIVIQSITTAYLAYWLNEGSGQLNSTGSSNSTNNTTSQSVNANGSLPESIKIPRGSVLDNPDLHTYAFVYAMFLVAMLILLVGRSALFVKILLRAANNLHKQLLKSTLASPMSFFDTTPIGIILNRFSADIDELDARLLFNCELFLQNVFLVLSALALITVIFPWDLIAILPAIAVFVVLVRLFAPILQQMKFMDNITRAPYLSHLTASVEGISTIHSFGQGQEFYSRFCDLLNKNSVPFFLFYAANRWLAVFLDTMTIVVTGATGFLIIFTLTPENSSSAGLALSFAIQITSLVQYTLRLSLETISRFSSVQRIQDYVETLEIEGSTINTDHYTPLSWPGEGKITFKQYNMRYNDGLPPVLKNISVSIQPQEKIGIVGNSGSGKSSLGVGLFRLSEATSGTIMIDDVNIRDVPLHILRDRLSIVVQDPVLFTGTIRYNLDPSGSINSDESLWDALEKCHMKSQINSLEKGLDTLVEENGRNFSMGERQLLSLARTLLRNTKILVLDEATASVDAATEVLVQQTIKECFKHCTVLMIAHRINTVWDCDKVLVMEGGKTVEFNHPSVLLQKSQSRFKFMFDLMKSQPRGSSVNEDPPPGSVSRPVHAPGSPRFSTSPLLTSPLALSPSPSPRFDCSPLRDSVIFDDENEHMMLNDRV